MTNRFTTLINKSIFIDANVILYHLSDVSDDATYLLEIGEKGLVSLVTSLRVMDEVFFKYILAVAAKKYGWSSKVLEKLRKDKEKAKEIADDLGLLKELFENFEVIEPTKSDFLKTIDIQKKWGLIGNDALTIVLMKRHNLRYIATADSDFQAVSWSHIIEGDWL